MNLNKETFEAIQGLPPDNTATDWVVKQIKAKLEGYNPLEYIPLLVKLSTAPQLELPAGSVNSTLVVAERCLEEALQNLFDDGRSHATVLASFMRGVALRIICDSVTTINNTPQLENEIAVQRLNLTMLTQALIVERPSLKTIAQHLSTAAGPKKA